MYNFVTPVDVPGAVATAPGYQVKCNFHLRPQVGVANAQVWPSGIPHTLDLPGPTWLQLDQPGPTWLQLDLPGFNLTYLALPGPTWPYLASQVRQTPTFGH